MKAALERLTPLAAALSALTTLACCLPLGVVGVAAASASVSLMIESLRPWLLGFSIALLGLGAYQVYRANGACHRRSRTSIILLWLSAFVVLLVSLFPQVLAGMLADWLP